MAIQQLFSGTAGKTDYIITAFEFLKPGDIEITVGTDPKTSPSDYSIEGSTIKFTSVPTVGATIKAERSTDISTKSHTYTAGSSITAQNLNDNQDQALFKIEEVAVDAVNAADLTGDHGAINVSSNGGTWTIKQDTIDGNHLKENILESKHIKPDAVDTSEIATNAVGSDELANNAVDTNAIQDDAVTYAKMQHMANASRVLGRPASGGSEVREVIITTDMIGESQVTKAKIANSAITEARLEVSNTPTNGYVLTAQTHKPDGSTNDCGLTWNPAPTIGGSILETVSYVCDGESFVQRGTTYNSTEVKDPFDLSTTPTIVPGSQVTYTPPANTKTVIYEFTFMDARLANAGNGLLWHGSLWLADGSNTPVEVFYSRLTRYSNGGSASVVMKWAFPIGGTANTNYGRVNSWTSPKTILMKARDYNNSNYVSKFHQTTYWNGQNEFEIHVPMITIIAIS